jgi:general secretion pathway protein A
MPMESDYFRMFNLTREPFSSSPDPDFLYQSRQHFGTLQQLENAIRNLSGISLTTGAPGTGKTTLMRHLYRKISHEKTRDVHLHNAEFCETVEQFEKQIVSVFGHFDADPFVHTLHHDMHFDRLLETLRDREKKVLILIDDGHLISREGLAVLNRLADLDDNKVQLMIFANRTIMDNVDQSPEFKSKITQHNMIGPLSFNDTRHMIMHRLRIAGNTFKQNPMFTYPALVAIYLATGGYPKKIVKLCHRLILSMSLRKTMKAGWFQARFCARRVLAKNSFIPDMVFRAAVLVLVVGAVFVILNTFGEMNIRRVIQSAGLPVGLSGTESETPLLVHEERADIPSTAVVPLPSEPEEAPKTPDNRSIADTVNEEPQAVESHVAMATDTPGAETEPPVIDGEKIGDTEAMTPVHSLPENLGTVAVKRGDSLLVMLEKVYGHSRSFYREYAVEANHHIPNINSLSIGDKIIFPLIFAKVDEPDGNAHWVRVATFKTLEGAFDFVRAWPGGAPRIKMIPLFREDTGFRVDVILKAVFKDRASTEKAISGLAGYPVRETEDITFLLKDTQFFSDPFFR